jgi:hypothetical protein
MSWKFEITIVKSETGHWSKGSRASRRLVDHNYGSLSAPAKVHHRVGTRQAILKVDSYTHRGRYNKAEFHAYDLGEILAETDVYIRYAATLVAEFPAS